MSVPRKSDSGAFAHLGYLDLLACSSQTLRKAENTRADVLLLERNGQFAVLKDYSHSSKGFSRFLAPWLVNREIRALALLKGIDGVPDLLQRVNKRAFVMQYIESRRIRATIGDIDAEQFVSDAQNLVAELHARGVAHGDLRNATNIMVDSRHQPVFVDFVSAFCLGHRLNFLATMLFGLCKRIDHGAIFKLKQKYAPGLLSEGEIVEFTNPGWLEKAARWISVQGRNLIQKLFP